MKARNLGAALWMAPRKCLAMLVGAYQLVLSPSVGMDCRFAPSCSHYAVQALHQRGALYGSALAAWRVVRCNPWCAGGYDPVPPRPQRGIFSRLLDASTKHL